jgi:CpXC motif protein
MSTYRLQEIHCPSGHGFEAEVFDSLHVSRRPDIRDQILDGTFHRFTCPRCDQAFLVENRLAYTDFPRRHWFTVFPRIDLRHRDVLAEFARRSFQDTMVDRAPSLVQGWAPDMIQRAVFGLAALREKLVVLDAGLDDRLVECLKLQLFRGTGLVLHPDSYLHVVAVESDTITMHYSPPGGTPRSLPVPRELYAMLEVEQAGLREEHPWLFDEIVVDYRSVLAPRTALVPASEPSTPVAAEPPRGRA